MADASQTPATRQDIAFLKTDITVLQSDVSSLKTDMTSVKADVGFLAQQFGTLLERADQTDQRFDQLEKKMEEWKDEIIHEFHIVREDMRHDYLGAYKNKTENHENRLKRVESHLQLSSM